LVLIYKEEKIYAHMQGSGQSFHRLVIGKRWVCQWVSTALCVVLGGVSQESDSREYVLLPSNLPHVSDFMLCYSCVDY